MRFFSIFIFFVKLSINCEAQPNYIITSFDYSSNTTTFGRFNTLVKQPSYSPTISFFSKHNFDVSGLFYVLGNSDSTFENATTEFDIMIGYEWEPVKNFTIYPSYSHFFYSKNSGSFKSGFTDNFQLDIDYILDFFNTGISANYLLGTENTGLVSFRNSILLEKEDFLFDNFYIALQPGVDLTWGNQQYYSNEILDRIENNPDRAGDILREYLSKPKVINDIRQLRKVYPDSERWDVIKIYINDQYLEKQSFNLNAVTLNLPAFFMIGSQFAFMFNVMYYKPINSPDYIEDDWKFYWSLGISYTFML